MPAEEEIPAKRNIDPEESQVPSSLYGPPKLLPKWLWGKKRLQTKLGSRIERRENPTAELQCPTVECILFSSPRDGCEMSQETFLTLKQASSITCKLTLRYDGPRGSQCPELETVRRISSQLTLKLCGICCSIWITSNL
ncbi:hypothetical protein BTVI_58228 [Pitangus sulphuratus]|nr:hypothetical protein BTVI_58228 [Pitangus sulphuratus]